MKLWDKNNNLDTLIESFTIGRDQELDLRLAPYDVQGSIAHVTMLASINLLTKEEKDQVIEGLNDILAEIKAGKFQIEDGVEDVHSQVEMLLTKRLGEVGKKIHAGRSRNDQVLLDIRLYLRDVLDKLAVQMEQLIDILLNKSAEHKDDLMPGMTHTQLAMVSSFGMWFGCYAEALIDDLKQLQFVRKSINQNPLGSAAGYGNSFPLDREMTTQLLNFESPCVNSMYAQFGRGKTELLVAQAISSCAYTLAKFSADICLFNNQQFAYVKLPDNMTTGSSIMPHKKNPDVFELLRAQCNGLQTLPTQIASICTNLTSGYHRDLQELKPIIFDGLDKFEAILEILVHGVPNIQVTKNLLVDEKYDLLFSVEEVNKLVLGGMSFREAYMEVKEAINKGHFKPSREIGHTHLGSVGNLGVDVIRGKMSSLDK